MKEGVDGVGPSLQDQQVLLSVATFDQFLLQSQLQDDYGPQIKPTQRLHHVFCPKAVLLPSSTS